MPMLNLGGSKWGVDANEDGKIEKWNMISAEETTAEVAAAIAARDSSRMMLVMMSEADMQTLGLNEKGHRTREGRSSQHAKALARSMSDAARNAVWTRMDASKPCMIPAARYRCCDRSFGLSQHHHHHRGCQGSQVLRATEIVRVGDTWKILDVHR